MGNKVSFEVIHQRQRYCICMDNRQDLHRRNKERVDQIEMSIDRLRMDGVVFLFLASLANDLNRFDAVVLFVAPIYYPHLVQVIHIENVDRISIRHNDLDTDDDDDDSGEHLVGEKKKIIQIIR